mgnify:CR=1 FL=1
MSIWLEQGLAAAHQLSAAAWFGALVYRTFFVDPKAKQFFERGSDYERYSLQLAHGMRGVVLLALLVCGGSGFILLGLRWNSSEIWQTLMAAKIAVWLTAFGVFTYISWVYWPKRVFIVETEYRQMRRQGLFLSLVMIAFAGFGIVLGQCGQVWQK